MKCVYKINKIKNRYNNILKEEREKRLKKLRSNILNNFLKRKYSIPINYKYFIIFILLFLLLSV